MRYYLLNICFGSLIGFAAQSQTPGSELMTANNKFAVDMYKKVLSDKKGVFFSPYSIYIALKMTGEGAAGKTATEMQKVLYSTTNGDKIRSDIQAAQTGYNSMRSQGDSIRTANSLWIQDGFPVNTGYSGMVKDFYKAGFNLVDFKKETEKSRLAINNKVEEETNKRIKNLVPQGAVDATTRLVLVNTIWFKGKWDSPFNASRTKEDKFYGEKETVNAKFMSNKETVNYYENKNLQLIEIPYESYKVAMYIILPAKGREAVIGQNLSEEQIAGWFKNMDAEEVAFSIPKFKMECDFELSKNLSAMGMPSAFGPNADFSGISTQPLQISQVIHKSFIEIDEAGTEAAAATAVVMRVGSVMIKNPKQPKIFKADRPFLFLLCDRDTKTILFMGQMTKPGS